METAILVIGQVFVILILLAVGAISYKLKLIRSSTADQMAAFALKVVTPCVIIKAYQIDFDSAKLYNMLIAGLLALLTHLIGIVLARLFFRKNEGANPILRFASIYSNCGFMGIPLIEGTVGQDGVIYACVYLIVFQAILWSHGVVTVKGGLKSIKFYKMFVNAGTIGIAIGLPLFFLSIRLPSVLSQAVNHIANLNTPLAMIVSGVYIAKSDIKKIFISPKLYLSVLLRHIIIPICIIGAIILLKPDPTVALTSLLIAACPTASAVTLFAALYGKKEDLEASSQILTLSNILSVLTIPLVILFYSAIR